MTHRQYLRSRNFSRTFSHIVRALAPTLIALSFAGVAHAQGTMDFSGAQTLMGTFKSVALDANNMRHFDHGYAVTSHSSQGLTAERVIVNIDTNVHPDLINRRFAYVSVSRASHDAQIYTNDAASLASNLSQDLTKSSAIDDMSVPRAFRGEGIMSELSL
jgi:hypothetical protein